MSDITYTERCDAIHELSKFVLAKTEIILRIKNSEVNIYYSVCAETVERYFVN